MGQLLKLYHPLLSLSNFWFLLPCVVVLIDAKKKKVMFIVDCNKGIGVEGGAIVLYIV